MQNKGYLIKFFIKILGSSVSIYLLILFLGSYLTYRVEIMDISANIKSYGDALWWAINATSIGDSNVYPVTISGRIIGVFLIMIGYGLFTVNVGVISAALTHFIKNKISGL